MLIRNPDALTPSDWVEAMSRPRKDLFQFTSFQIYRNGVLDHVMNGPESLVRNRMSVLYNLHPDDNWDYAPTRHWHDFARD